MPSTQAEAPTTAQSVRAYKVEQFKQYLIHMVDVLRKRFPQQRFEIGVVVPQTLSPSPTAPYVGSIYVSNAKKERVGVLLYRDEGYRIRPVAAQIFPQVDPVFGSILAQMTVVGPERTELSLIILHDYQNIESKPVVSR